VITDNLALFGLVHWLEVYVPTTSIHLEWRFGSCVMRCDDRCRQEHGRRRPDRGRRCFKLRNSGKPATRHGDANNSAQPTPWGLATPCRGPWGTRRGCRRHAVVRGSALPLLDGHDAGWPRQGRAAGGVLESRHECTSTTLSYSPERRRVGLRFVIAQDPARFQRVPADAAPTASRVVEQQ
jgi:hypothetical protein